MKSIIKVLLFLSLFSCERQVERDIAPAVATHPVVEAILTDELKVQEIKITKGFINLNDSIPEIIDADVRVRANGRLYRFLHESAGIYKSEEPFKVAGNVPYELRIDIDGEIYSSESRLSAVAPIPEIKFKRYQKTDSLELANFIPEFNPNQQAMYEVLIDWSHLTNEGVTRAKMLLYTFSTVDISQINPVSRESVPFPIGSLVQVRKFGLNDEFAEYLRALSIETDWNGTFFYSSGFNLPTNISNEGLGFFVACAVEKKTVVARP